MEDERTPTKIEIEQPACFFSWALRAMWESNVAAHPSFEHLSAPVGKGRGKNKFNWATGTTPTKPITTHLSPATPGIWDPIHSNEMHVRNLGQVTPLVLSSGISSTHRTKSYTVWFDPTARSAMFTVKLEVAPQTYLNTADTSCSFKCSLNFLRFLKVKEQSAWVHCGRRKKRKKKNQSTD